MLIPKFAKSVSPSVIHEMSDAKVPWGPVGYIAYKRTYARKIQQYGRTEEWHESIERGCNGLLEIGSHFTQEQIDRLAWYWFYLKGTPAGRPIWQLGTDTVRRNGGDSLMNCWHVAVNHPIDPFCFAFNELMLGGGVGFNILPEHVYELPIVKHNVEVTRVDDFDCDFIVTDNREGWIDLLRRVLESFYFTGKSIRYDTRCIRAKGRPINGFGGTASGPEELVRGIGQIAVILRANVGRKLRPIHCMDIMNIIGSIVVAGNVRRSAEIAIGSAWDEEFVTAKDWSRKKVPAHRQMSNNTVDCEDPILLPDFFWKAYSPGNGEAYGLFNSSLARRCGRLIDGENYRPDPKVVGPNPCGEIILESYEACNLAEQFLPNIADVQEFGEVAALLFTANKAISNLPCWHPKTNEVVTRNMRIGLSITGFLEAPHLHDPDIFDAVYTHLEDTDRKLSREMGVARSIKLTTVKPSGTLSLLAGCTPGVHAAFSPYYIRRISFDVNDPLVDIARDHGYFAEPKINIDGSRDYNTIVIDFPCKSRQGTQCAKGYSAISQLENQKFLQTHWADNAVSMTCYYRPEELPSIKTWLREHYNESIKTASFGLHSEHGFQQAPYQEITRNQFLESSSKVKIIDHITDAVERTLLESQECSGATCPIR